MGAIQVSSSVELMISSLRPLESENLIMFRIPRISKESDRIQVAV
jgi:hypothetical protein